MGAGGGRRAGAQTNKLIAVSITGSSPRVGRRCARRRPSSTPYTPRGREETRQCLHGRLAV